MTIREITYGSGRQYVNLPWCGIIGDNVVIGARKRGDKGISRTGASAARKPARLYRKGTKIG